MEPDLAVLRKHIEQMAQHCENKLVEVLDGIRDPHDVRRHLDSLGWPHGPAVDRDPLSRAIERRIGSAAIVRVLEANQDRVYGVTRSDAH